MDKNDLLKGEEIVDVNFDDEDSHLAHTHQLQGGSASGWETVLLKAKTVDADIIKAVQKVQVELSFEEFLKKFFDMWSSDAETLTKVLGFQTDYEAYLESVDENKQNYSHTDFLEEKVKDITLLKSVSNLIDIPDDRLLSVVNLQKSFEDGVKALESKNTDEKPTDEELTTVDIQEILKSAEMQEFLQTTISKATADLTEKLEAREADLKKASEAINKFEQIEQTRIEKSYTNLVDTLEFVEEEARDDTVQAIIKARSSDADSTAFFLMQLRKAQEKIESVRKEFIDSDDGVASDTSADNEPSSDVDIQKSAELSALEELYADKQYL